MSEKNLPVSPPLDEPAELQDTPLVQRISFTTKLRGEQMNAKEVKQDEDRRSLCGLRNTFEAVSRLPGHLKLGSIFGEFFRGILWKNPRLHKLLVSLGSGDVPEDEQNEARIELEDLVLPIRQKLSKILLCSHSGPVNNDECDTDIRAELLRRWATVARDPGVGVCNWLSRGANAGLSADPEGIDGIFPLADTEFEEFEADECIPTQSAESLDNDSMEHIEGYAKKGWLEETSRQELIQEFGSDFTVSRFCVIS